MIRTETDIEECRKLWNMFSPSQDAWGDWDLMFAFHDQKNHRLNFLVHQTGDGNPDGLIPLVHDSKLNRYMLMAGSYPDGRILWLKNQDVPDFFAHFRDRTVLFDIRKSWVSSLLHPQFEASFAEEDLRYYLVPSEFGFDFYQHIETFSSDKKQKFLFDLRNIRKREPKLVWSDEKEADLFIELVNRNFGAESDYANPEDAEEIRRVINELERRAA